MQRRSGFRHRTKGIARMMVFVWMFALMTSFANASVLSGGANAASFGHLYTAGHRPDAGIVGAGSDQDHESGPAKAACKGFCELERNTVLKSNASFGLDAGAAPLPQADFWSAASTRATPRVLLAGYCEPPPGPPVVIRFLRLTL